MIVAHPVKGRDGRWGEIVPEPEHNEYGRFHVYARSDGRFVVFDPNDPNEAICAAPAFPNEADARAWTKALTSGRTCRRCGDPLMPEENDAACAGCEVAA